MHSNWIKVSLATLLFVLVGGGCSAPDRDERATIGSVAQKQAVALGFDLPLGATFNNTAVAAVSGKLQINDRARIEHDRTPPPGVAIYPVAASMGESEIGADARVGTLISAGNVTLRSHAQSQIVETGGRATKQQGATVSELSEEAAVTPSTHVAFDIDVPTGPGGDVPLEPGSEPTVLAPGEYGHVSVKNSATLRLSSGSYSFESLQLEPGAELSLINEFGNVNIHVRNQLVHRGSIAPTNPDSATVLFLYEGSSTAFIESPFVGVLVAPNARIVISGPAATHVGAFFGRSVELHQGHVVVHRPLADAQTLGCDVADFSELEDHPFDRSRDIDNDVQGVTHSEDRWFFTNAKRDFCGLADLCDFSHIWSFPVLSDVSDDPMSIQGNPWQGEYNHFGDITYVRRDGLPGLIYVALEHGAGADVRRGAIGVLDESLTPVGRRELPLTSRAVADPGNSMPWVTYDGDGTAYSAAFDSGWLNSYRVDASASTIEIQHVASTRFRDCRTDAPAFVRRKQGAGMSPSGKLYISVDVQGGGVLVVDPETGRIRDFARVTFDPGGEDEELEGVTVWNLDGVAAPGIDGHVHVQMVQNDTFSNDNFYFKHLRADDFDDL